GSAESGGGWRQAVAVQSAAGGSRSRTSSPQDRTLPVTGTLEPGTAPAASLSGEDHTGAAGASRRTSPARTPATGDFADALGRSGPSTARLEIQTPIEPHERSSS